MLKTTVYLPEGLKRRLAAAAARRGLSEADLIRAGIEKVVNDERPRPHVALFRSDDPIAERVDEELAKGFGRD